MSASFAFAGRLPERVRLVEVGPRDGLQNEPHTVPLEAKLALIEALAEAGLHSIESGAFVSPKWVPQMADTAEVLSRLKRKPGVSYPVLVPNLQGLELALGCSAREIAVFAAASETFSLRNTNVSIRESLVRLEEVTRRALLAGMRVRGYVSCVMGCPYEGHVDLNAVLRVAEELAGMGCYEISLGDTIGVGTPLETQALICAVEKRLPLAQIAVHFHDTWGQALANILAALALGVTVIDSSVAGLGGCPYAPGASGNVATEDVLYMLQGMGIETGVNLEKVALAGAEICRILWQKPASRAAAALLAQMKAKEPAE
jgi:hydroxymethylglutaryl-CoA lyase